MASKKSATSTAKELKISQVGDFKKRLGGVFELPSGMVVKLRNPGGMAAFMAAGIIPNSLLTVVQGSLDKGKNVDPEELVDESGDMDPEKLKDMLLLLNEVAVRSIIEPQVHPMPADGEERDDDVLYADELEDNDKMFVFQWITGGTSDLESFRKQHSDNVDALESVAVAKRNTI